MLAFPQNRVSVFIQREGGRVGSRGGGGGGGAKGAETPPPPLQINEMRNIHFGQNTNSHLSETSEKLACKDTTA